MKVAVRLGREIAQGLLSNPHAQRYFQENFTIAMGGRPCANGLKLTAPSSARVTRMRLARLRLATGKRQASPRPPRQSGRLRLKIQG